MSITNKNNRLVVRTLFILWLGLKSALPTYFIVVERRKKNRFVVRTLVLLWLGLKSALQTYLTLNDIARPMSGLAIQAEKY
ncbi:MAG: hypothetical protein EAZ60_28590 [Oscillatoriales cyanobacterium]|nr:MAG: hypothetical protein EAZ83_21505 [Oscillatoriales cyanobacterium]TAE97605.1 MAG: hypothetical protein EAZ79_10205 [Oscillatoriales cyanobacterium]TAF16968.1 MAG: hypothetical protein EAZ73_22865 [Oscillatoriales cyanobacterium]TAF28447.1 MAG: hypothetical protein EAZ69_26680 [Oscillatoriales cyanobacterium]TAF50535.1 MAG: hypothetical protein EAZ60_28590 [Oscillatoriales cyanobacterium]